MSRTRSKQSKTTYEELPWQGRLYAIRVLFTIMVLVLLVVNDAVCHNQPGAHLWLILAGALYPHLGNVLLGRFEGRRHGGYAMMICDGLFCGAVMASIGLASAPSAALAAINLFNWIAVGGPALVALGASAGLLGIMLSGAPAIWPSTLTCMTSDTLAGIVLIGYFIVLGRFIHHHIGKLRQQHSQFQTDADTAARARATADRALAAVLPASAAEILLDKGEVPTETLDHATMLLIEFSWEGAEPLSIAGLADSFQICDSVISRHGFECIKTFGRRYLAVSRAQSGPDDAIAIAREVNSYLLDHGSLRSSPFRQRAVRAFIHCGTISAGLVQPSRLNFEILGEPMEAMNALAAFGSKQPMGNVIVSAQAQRRMQMSSGFVALAAETDAAAYLLPLAPSP